MPRELDGMTIGDAAFLAPPRTKPDQLGEIHCPFPDFSAAALRDIEKRCSCHGAERDWRPVIAKSAILDNLLHNMLAHCFGKAMASLSSAGTAIAQVCAQRCSQQAALTRPLS